MSQTEMKVSRKLDTTYPLVLTDVETTWMLCVHRYLKDGATTWILNIPWYLDSGTTWTLPTLWNLIDLEKNVMLHIISDSW